jgi:hypothetical protein
MHNTEMSHTAKARLVMHRLLKAISFASVLGLGFCQILIANAESPRGTVVKTEGDVRIIRADGSELKAGKNVIKINRQDTIVSGQNGKAVVRYNDGAMTVLVNESRLQVGEPGFFSHLSGKIYYHFRKVIGDKPREVKTSYATLGVRGTTFIVDDRKDTRTVSLKEGRLNVESPGPTFEIHRGAHHDEYNKFKEDIEQGVQGMKEEYKAHLQQINQEFIEFKKDFTLLARRTIRVKGNRVDETGFSPDTEAEFDRYEKIGGELLQEFKQTSVSH